MSDPLTPNVSAPPATRLDPDEPAGAPGFFDRIMHHGGTAALDGAEQDVRTAIQGHAGLVFALAGKVLGDPALRAVAPDVLSLVESAARIAGVAL